MRSLSFWVVIVILALTTLACGFSRPDFGSKSRPVVILTRLPTFTPTPRVAAGQVAAEVVSTAGQPSLSTITTTPEVATGQIAAAVSTAGQPGLPTITATLEVATGSGQVAVAALTAGQPTLPTITATPEVAVDQVVAAASTAGQLSLPTATAPPPPLEAPTATPPSEIFDDWLFVNTRFAPNQAEQNLRVYGEMINNSGVSQKVAEVSGVFYDAQGQVSANAEQTAAYWSVDIIPPGGRVPFELVVEDIQSAADFTLNVEAEPSSIIPHHDFDFLNLNQRQEGDTYCLTGQFQNPGHELQNYLVIGATLYDPQDNIVNFGDYFEADLESKMGAQSLDFEICVAPPNQEATRYELWAWGE